MRKLFEIGGIVATTVLVVFGVVSIAMGVNGRNTVHNSLALEQIVGTPDMNATAIAAEAKKAGLPASIRLPTADIAGKPINTGQRPVLRELHADPRPRGHGGLRCKLPRYASADGKGTSDTTKALKSPSGQPLDNPVRDSGSQRLR